MLGIAVDEETMPEATAILDQIAKEVAQCTKCSLCKSRTRTVPGEGDASAKLMFIGEAPGYHEDQQGRPFVGQSGDLLNKLLKALNIPREDVFIANVVKCRPPGNQDPTPDQIAACKPYLDRQIGAIDPRVIVTLGRFSMARYFPGQRISQIHGQAKKEGGRIYLPMFHPAAALRDNTRATMQKFKEDGFKIPDLLVEAEELSRAELWGLPSTPDPEPEPVKPDVAAAPGLEAVPDSGITTLADAPIANHEIEGAEPPVQPAEIAQVPVKATRARKPKAAALEVEANGNGTVAETGGGIIPVAEATSETKEKDAKEKKPAKKRTPPEGEQLTLF
jgi:uracil-DNA glycosylase